MYQLSKWMPIVTSTLVVAAVGATGLGCDAVNCGDGTIERDGTCVPANDQVDDAQCGPGTVLGAGGRCEPEEVVVCDPDTTDEVVDPETGVVTCVGRGEINGCTGPIACPAPSANRITICGQLYDSQTDQPIAAPGATGAACPGTPTADGPCSLRIQFFDALEFAMNPATATPRLPAGGLTVDDCGRYRAVDLPQAGFGFMGVAVDDAVGATDRYRQTGVALANEAALPARGFRAYATRITTDMAWSTTAGLTGATFATRGVLAAIFTYGGAPVSGVTLTRGGGTATADDYYFSDSNAQRTTVDAARNVTGNNGTALVVDTVNAGVTDHSGMGAEPASCQWPSSLAAAIPNVVFMQVKAAEMSVGVACP